MRNGTDGATVEEKILESAMDGRADVREVVDRFFAEREAAASGGFGSEARDAVRGRREHFARAGRLDAEDAVRLRMWAANRPVSAFELCSECPAVVEEAVSAYVLVARWIDRPRQPDLVTTAEWRGRPERRQRP